MRALTLRRKDSKRPSARKRLLVGLGIAYIVVGVAGLVLLLVKALSDDGGGKPPAADAGVPSGDRSQYVRARDGTPLAVSYSLPQAASTGRVPTFLRISRYPVGPAETGQAGILTGNGFAVVTLDDRGTGASRGRWRLPWTPTEVADSADVVRWIARQPWSNGRVATYGFSYDGGAAEAAASSGVPGLRAAAPLFIGSDPYLDIVYPGGIFNRWFMAAWTESNRSFDAGEGYDALDSDPGSTIYDRALADHKANVSTYDATRRAPFRDSPLAGSSYAAISGLARQPRVARAGVVEYALDGWWDSGFARGALARFVQGRSSQVLTIGPWNHGGEQGLDPLRPAGRTPPLGDSDVAGVARALAEAMAAPEPPQPTYRLRYYTLGEGRWHTTSSWPPQGVRTSSVYLTRTRSMATNRPRARRAAPVRYRVDRSATTGHSNRWHGTLAGAPVRYPNRCVADRKLLTYTSPPLARPLEVTGTPWVRLELAATSPDASVHTYFEDVAPDGTVSYISEGELRALNRATTGFGPLGPIHPFTRRAARPLHPGRPAALNIGLMPISARFPSGHRLRIAIAGADADTFATLPARGGTTFSLYHQRVHASSLHLPVRGGAAQFLAGARPLPRRCP
jgi:putative CocE/NonD family hydrolase